MAPVAATSAELARFRLDARSFLAFHTVTGGDEVAADDPRGDRALDRALAFQRQAYAAGFAGLSVPTAYGGRRGGRRPAGSR